MNLDAESESRRESGLKNAFRTDMENILFLLNLFPLNAGVLKLKGLWAIRLSPSLAVSPSMQNR